ncbi:MAG: haloacid dehalogenase type II [Hydrococcus sp. Prado102]|jgi:2-haloacid dehalogenase|nr:haloacid dehalogenase type II [Hydrococcus sp. Prado102]
MSLQFERYEVLTFDCYGTLIDWETGILTALTPLLAARNINLDERQILELFAEFEPELELRSEYMTYREVLRGVIKKFGDRFNFAPSEEELHSLPESIKNWQPFSDTVEALKLLKQRFKLGILSNIDDDLFADSAQYLQVKFDWIITAKQAKSYKPSHNNFKLAFERIGLPTDKILHVAQSIYHDIVPARSLGLSTVWVNRRIEKEGFGATKAADEKPDLEVPNLQTLAEIILGK